jgi:hypothetical protein
MKPNNRITYRFDVPETKQPEKDKPERRIEVLREQDFTPYVDAAGQATSSKNNVVPLYQQSSSNVIDEAQPWHNAYQEDIGALEQLIREANPGSASMDGGDVPKESGAVSSATVKGADEQWIPIRAEAMLPPHQLQPTPSASTKSDRLLIASEDGVSERRVVQPFDLDVAETGGANLPQLGGMSWDGSATSRTPAISRRSGGKGPSWLHVFLSVGGALATGAIFGYLILSLFTGATVWTSGEKPANGENVPVAQTETREPIGLDDLGGTSRNGGEEKGGNESALPAATVNLGSLARTYTLLQFGLFSNAEGRDAAIKQLRDGGLAAAAMKTAEGYRVYAGIALDGNKAGLISSGLPDIVLYKKEVAVQAPERLPFAGGEETALAFFTSTNDLIAAWSDLVVAQLEQPSLSPLGSVAAEGWRSRHEQWTAHASAMKEGIPDPTGETYYAKLRTAIDNAAAAMTEYDKTPSKAHLWSAESALMEAVLAQKEWFESSSAL